MWSVQPDSYLTNTIKSKTITNNFDPQIAAVAVSRCLQWRVLIGRKRLVVTSGIRWIFAVGQGGLETPGG